MVEKGGVKLELTQGDIASQKDVEAVVNAANAQLKTGGGVAGAIHRAAGPELADAGQKYAPIEPGEAVTTDAFDLPNDYVIHCLGPVYGQDKPEDELLASCYREGLKQAEDHGVRSVAFPAISTGAFGYPVEEAAGVAFETILDEIPSLDSVELIRFVLFDQSALDLHERVLDEVS
jgi:O-acetyl-ADP-ribose deacetylase (regulator of RNase III)